jgi:DNA-binding SARP family transcriptional activator
MPLPKGNNSIADKHLTIVTLGSVALVSDDAGTPVMGPGKPVALLTYLACAPARTASRDHLVELLWADADPERARHALRQTLWQIRGVLGEHAVTGKEELTLSLELPTDRGTFLALIEADRLEDAVAVYHGPFFPAFAAAGGAAFEHWADVERERLRTMFVRAADRLARRQLAEGNPRAALATARRLLIDADESVIGHRLAIEAHLALGDGISAADEADALERWSLDAEMPLDAAARATIQRARDHLGTRSQGGTPTAQTSQQLVAELVGREEQFAAMVTAWHAVKEGHSRHMHIVAPAGIGKTRLLRDLESRLHHAGAQVRYLRAHPGDRELPGAMASELARVLVTLPGAKGVAPEVAATLVGLDPSLANTYSVSADPSSGSEAQRRRVFALAELLRATSEEGPYTLLLDDLHWSDSESLSLLEALLTRQESTRYLLVTATRPIADRALRSERRTLIALAPLTTAQVGQLLTSLGCLNGGGALDDLPAVMTAGTGGNPLLILELLQLAGERGLLRLEQGNWHAADHDALRALLGAGQGIRQRLNRLGPEARALMLSIGIAGAPASSRSLASAAALSVEIAEPKLELLERQGFVRQVDGQWEAEHDEIAAAAVDQLDAEVADTRRRLAKALADSGYASRAMQQYRALGDVAAMARIASDAIAQARRRGRRLSPTAAVEELIGRSAEPALIRTILRAMPLRVRYRPLAPVALAATVAVLALTAAVSARDRRVADSTLVLSWYERDGSLTQAEVPLFRDGWSIATDLSPVKSSAGVLRHLGPEGAEYPVRYSLSGDSAVTTMRRPGSDNLEIVLLTRDSLIWLTDAPRDDVAPVFLPDGSGISFLSSRWSPIGDDATDIAVLTLADRTLRRVTATDDVDHTPILSPDGTRFAHVRRFEAAAPAQLCLTAWDGSTTRCLALEGLALQETIGWLDHDNILVLVEGDGGVHAAMVNARTGAATVLLRNSASRVAAGSGHTFLACLCEDPDSRRLAVRVAPLDAPDAWRTVTLPEGAIPNDVALRRPARQSRLLNHLQIVASGELRVGNAYRFRLEGFRADGRPVAFDTSAVRWRSDDPTLLTVDSLTGTATGVRLGSTVVRVTAGGWRSDTLVVTVKPSLARVLFLEDWSAASDRWRIFGQPMPRLGAHPTLGSALHVNGDGVFISGVYLGTGMDPRAGVTVEAIISTPIRDTKWQTLGIGISPATDSAALERWDHRSSFPAGSRLRVNSDCGFGVPSGEGTAGRERYHVIAGHRSWGGTAPASMRLGSTYRVRLMLGADGRCHVAIDGEPVFVSTNALSVETPVRLWLYGNSVGTDIAVGKVTVWEGDPGGVDWGKLEWRQGQKGP